MSMNMMEQFEVISIVKKGRINYFAEKCFWTPCHPSEALDRALQKAREQYTYGHACLKVHLRPKTLLLFILIESISRHILIK